MVRRSFNLDRKRELFVATHPTISVTGRGTILGFGMIPDKTSTIDCQTIFDFRFSIEGLKIFDCPRSQVFASTLPSSFFLLPSSFFLRNNCQLSNLPNRFIGFRIRMNFCCCFLQVFAQIYINARRAFIQRNRRSTGTDCK
jgi:hypothetical protein